MMTLSDDNTSSRKPVRERLSLDPSWLFHAGDVPMPELRGHYASYMNAKAGTAWGADDPSNPLNAAIKRDDRPEPTGKLLVWLNPKLGEEPNEANADVNVPLHEFRINCFDARISKGAALDEIRVGTSFQQVNH